MKLRLPSQTGAESMLQTFADCSCACLRRSVKLLKTRSWEQLSKHAQSSWEKGELTYNASSESIGTDQAWGHGMHPYDTILGLKLGWCYNWGYTGLMEKMETTQQLGSCPRLVLANWSVRWYSWYCSGTSALVTSGGVGPPNQESRYQLQGGVSMMDNACRLLC